MNVQFLKSDCQQEINKKRFGLYDAEDKTPTEIRLTNEETWNAVVLNNDRKDLTFKAIDNCIDVLRPDGQTDSRCDCMLTYDSTILFIELKNKRESWQSEGLEQIESIVKIMIAQNPKYYYNFTKHKAIVANKRHQFPAFQESNLEQRQYFSSKYRMRIQFEAEIIIK